MTQKKRQGDILFMRASVQLRSLDQTKDFQAVHNVIMDGLDYAMIVNGEPPASKDVADFFTAIAPGKSLHDMLKLGIEENGDFIGIVEIARNFPLNHTWHIGLLMLHSSRRHKGIGRDVLQKIEEKARLAGASHLRIAVIEENAEALSFWAALGFAEVNRLSERSFGIKKHTVIELTRPIQ